MLETPKKELLLEKAHALTRNRFTPGVDGINAERNLRYLLTNGELVEKELAEGKYKPKPAITFAAVNRKGKQRELCRLCAIDAVIQRAAAEILSNALNDMFSAHSFGYIEGRGRQAAAVCFAEYAAKYPAAAKLDPRSCFDSIDRELLYKSLAELIGEGSFMQLVRAAAECETADEKGFHSSEKGILQGSPLSPILCNVYFHGLDMMLERMDIPFIRYADDVVAFAADAETASERAKLISDYLTGVLGLELAPEKMRVGSALEMEYLGYAFFEDAHGGAAFAEETESDRARFSENWESNRFNADPKRISILADGVLSHRELALMFERSAGSGEAEDDAAGSRLLPLGSMRQLNVFSSVVFAPQVLKAAFDNGVRINVFDRFGELLGRFEPASGFKDVRVPLNQLTIYNRSKGLRMYYARELLLAHLHHVILNLRYRKRRYHNEKCSQAAEALKELESSVKTAKTVDELLLLEAEMQKTYFGCFDEFLSNPWFRFEKRTRRPPKNEVNAMLSFGNTFLCNYIATAINKTSLDIRIAYLHSTTSRMESLNLDIADIFKPLIVDRTVFALINKRMISPLNFVREDSGAVYLTNSGKKLLIAALHEKLDSSVPVGEEQKTYAEIIRDEIASFVSDVRELRRHKCFRQVR